MALYKAEVISKKKLAEDIYELDVRLLDGASMEFKAGQCVGFHLGHNEADPKDKRLYSIASLPVNGKDLSFCVDVSPMGGGSKFVLGLKPKDTMLLEGPYGGFTVSGEPQNLLFISTGVGVAPFRSIVPDLLQSGYPKDVTLLFGVRSEKNKFYFDFFEELSNNYENFFFFPALSQPEGKWNGIKGRVTDFLAQNIEGYKGQKAYICGGTEMIKDVRAQLLAAGWSAKDIKLEIFV